jgi:hypothetical protein
MRYRPIFPKTTLFFTICLALGCSKKSDAPEVAETTEVAAVETETVVKPTLEYKLLGVYEVTQYQQSLDTCDKLVDIADAPSYLVVYHFEPSDGSSMRLGGAFCGEPNLCRAIGTKAAEPGIGYSFIRGDDASGWRGWAIVETGSFEGKCSATVQAHTLSASAPDTIRVETKTVDVFFEPVSQEDDVATCSNKQAIAVANDAESCKSLLVLKARREADR